MITTKLHPAFNSPIDDNVDGIQIDYKRVLADLLELNLSLLEIAKNHGLNLAQLIAWAAQPAVRALLDAADELARRIAAHKAAQGRPAAVQTLIGQTWLCESPREQQLANLAARTIVRITTPPKPASRRANKSADSSPSSDMPNPPPPTGVRAMVAKAGAAPVASDSPASSFPDQPNSSLRPATPIHRIADLGIPGRDDESISPLSNRHPHLNGHTVPSAEPP